jgi:hypothetical protein
MLGARHHG